MSKKLQKYYKLPLFSIVCLIAESLIISNEKYS